MILTTPGLLQVFLYNPSFLHILPSSVNKVCLLWFSPFSVTIFRHCVLHCLECSAYHRLYIRFCRATARCPIISVAAFLPFQYILCHLMPLCVLPFKLYVSCNITMPLYYFFFMFSCQAMAIFFLILAKL